MRRSRQTAVGIIGDKKNALGYELLRHIRLTEPNFVDAMMSQTSAAAVA